MWRTIVNYCGHKVPSIAAKSCSCVCHEEKVPTTSRLAALLGKADLLQSCTVHKKLAGRRPTRGTKRVTTGLIVRGNVRAGMVPLLPTPWSTNVRWVPSGEPAGPSWGLRLGSSLPGRAGEPLQGERGRHGTLGTPSRMRHAERAEAWAPSWGEDDRSGGPPTPAGGFGSGGDGEPEARAVRSERGGDVVASGGGVGRWCGGV